MKIRWAAIGGAVLIVAVTTIAQIPTARAAQCVTVKLVDRTGVVIPTDQPIVGIMVGGRPAIEATIPTGAQVQAGPPAPCPEALITITQDAFNESCTSEEKRAREATARRADRALIDKGCRDLADALNSAR